VPLAFGCGLAASNGILVSPAQEAETNAKITKPTHTAIKIFLVSMKLLLIFSIFPEKLSLHWIECEKPHQIIDGDAP
jgi:hypothetical protein